MTRPTLVSLFSGAGGLDLGLERAGFEVRLCLEKKQERCNSIKENRPKWNVLCSDVCTIQASTIFESAGLRQREIGLISAGPPCQPYSKAAFWIPGRIQKICSDPQDTLLMGFVRLVRKLKPAAYMMENVQGLTYKPFRSILENAISLLKQAGYTANVKILNAEDYGVPQKRHRLFIIGAKDKVSLRFPFPTHSKIDNSKSHYVTAGSAIGDLDDGSTETEEKVNGKWGHLLSEIPPGENYLCLTKERGHPNPPFRWRSKYWSFLLKLSPKLPSWTIQANPGPYVGPFHWNDRYLRIAEIKRLQTFPDEWKVSGPKKEKWAQIADAVPPMLAEKIGRVVLAQLMETKLLEA